jgi:hypothetical protein
MRRCFIEIDPHAFERLVELALAERRPTRDQAGLLLEQAIEQKAVRSEAGQHAEQSREAVLA